MENQTQIIEDIIQQCRLRNDYQKLRVSTELRVQAICRNFYGGDADSKKLGQALYAKICKLYKAGDKSGEADVDAVLQHVSPMLQMIDGLKDREKFYEKWVAGLAKKLSVYEWVRENVPGIGELTLGKLIGETGDLGNYSNPAKVWKRMGLAVIDGERQRKCLDKDKAIKHGYNPRRRSLMYVVGTGIVRAAPVAKRVGKPTHYDDIYRDRKEYEFSKGDDVRPGAADMRARRFMEKRLLRDLWVAWNEVAA